MKIYLDDERPTPDGWVGTRTVDETIELLKQGGVTHLSLDNDLGIGYREGRYVADWIEHMVRHEKWVPPEHIYAHSMNPVARKRMLLVIENIKRYHADNEAGEAVGGSDSEAGSDAV